MQITTKIIGIIFIMSFGFLLSKSIVGLLGRRSGILLEICRILKSIKNSFYFRQSNAIFAFNSAMLENHRYFDMDISNIPAKDFKKELSKRFENSQNINLLLNPRQKELLRETLLCCGTGTVDEECDRLDYFINYFNEEYTAANSYEMRNKKLFVALSFYLSIVIAVVIV